MKFCSQCGQAVVHRIPSGDDRPRYICDHCGAIHYENPRIIVGCLPVIDDKVLLCRRAIEPRRGFWTLPAGFMENGETTLEGALRETWEEARARIGQQMLYRMFDLPHINQVYMFYRGLLLGPQFAPGEESLEVDLFREQDIPWQDIAFPVVLDTLRDYFDDRRRGEFAVRISGVNPAWQKDWQR